MTASKNDTNAKQMCRYNGFYMLTICIIIAIICSLAICYWDIRERIIPDVWLWPLFLSGLFIYGDSDNHVMAAILGYVIGFVMLAVAHRIQGIGYGDVKLLAAIGIWLGIDGLSYAVVAACAYGIIWGLVKKKKFVPFAPFMAAGVATYMIYLY